MIRRIVFHLLPAALLPLAALCTVSVILFSAEIPAFEFIMERIFFSNAFIPLGLLLCFSWIAAISSIICCVSSLRKSTDALLLSKVALYIKLAQIPFYVLSFVVGTVCAISLLSIPFTLILLLFNFTSLASIGLVNSAAIMIARRQARFTRPQSCWLILTQYLFCIDLISSAICFNILRKQSA